MYLLVSVVNINHLLCAGHRDSAIKDLWKVSKCFRVLAVCLSPALSALVISAFTADYKDPLGGSLARDFRLPWTMAGGWGGKDRSGGI